MISWLKTMSCSTMLANQKRQNDPLVAQWNEIVLKLHKAKTLIKLEVYQMESKVLQCDIGITALSPSSRARSKVWGLC